MFTTHPDLAKLVHIVIIKSDKGLSFAVVAFVIGKMFADSSVSSGPK